MTVDGDAKADGDGDAKADGDGEGFGAFPILSIVATGQTAMQMHVHSRTPNPCHKHSDTISPLRR